MIGILPGLGHTDACKRIEAIQIDWLAAALAFADMTSTTVNLVRSRCLWRCLQY